MNFYADCSQHCCIPRMPSRAITVGTWVMGSQWRTQEFFSGGVQQIQLRTEDREDGDLWVVTP